MEWGGCPITDHVAGGPAKTKAQNCLGNHTFAVNFPQAQEHTRPQNYCDDSTSQLFTLSNRRQVLPKMSAPQSVQCFGKKKTGTAVLSGLMEGLENANNLSQPPQSPIARYAPAKNNQNMAEREKENENSQTVQKGKGLIKVNGKPLNLVQPEILRFKVRRKRSFSVAEELSHATQHHIEGQDAHMEFIGLRASPDRRSRQVRRRRYPRPTHWWRTHFPGLRHPSSHLQVHRCLLPEVR